MRSFDYSPTFPLWKVTKCGSRSSPCARDPPPPLKEAPTAMPRTGTPVHHEWSYPHPPHVDLNRARSGHPHQGALPSHNGSVPAHPIAHEDTAHLAYHHAWPLFLVPAFSGLGLRGKPPPAAPLLCPHVRPHALPPWSISSKCGLSKGPSCTM